MRKSEKTVGKRKKQEQKGKTRGEKRRKTEGKR